MRAASEGPGRAAGYTLKKNRFYHSPGLRKKFEVIEPEGPYSRQVFVERGDDLSHFVGGRSDVEEIVIPKNPKVFKLDQTKNYTNAQLNEITETAWQGGYDMVDGGSQYRAVNPDLPRVNVGKVVGKEAELTRQVVQKIPGEWRPETLGGVTGRKLPVTLESGGLQTVIEKGTKAVKGLWDGWQNTYINPPTEQADDVVDMVRDILKHEYKPLVTKQGTRKVLRGEARRQGYKLTTTKDKGINVRKNDETIAQIRGKNATVVNNKLSQYLGLGDDAKKYRDELYDLELTIEAEEGANAFVRWAFPDGLSKVSYEQAFRAAEKFDDVIKRGGGLFGKTSQAFEVGARHFWQPSTVLGRTPSGMQPLQGCSSGT
jgi:hypothetical protein